MPELLIDPVTRLEGHLSARLKVESERVVDSRCEGMLWRGFEVFLVGRDPRDAPIIVSRVCGVCHEVHRITSILALEEMAKITPPR